MDHFHMSLYTRLDGIVNAVNPRKSVVFALDGPAPLAKLMTQRSRRKKVILTEAMEKGKVVPFLALTPGTPFMAEVNDSLAFYICQRLLSKKYSHLHYELSGATVQGEGEVKILSRLHRPAEHVAQNDSHAVIGSDADLILMALLADAPNLHICGEVLHSSPPPPPNKIKVLSVNALHKLWQGIGPPAEQDPQKKLQRLQGMQQDLALTTILGKGNDYLPSVQGISARPLGGGGLWKTYLEMRQCPKYQKRALANRGADGYAVIDAEFLADLLEKMPTQPQVLEVTANLKAADPEQYLQGLSWNLDMYQKGVCPDYGFCYDGLGPTATELCRVLRNFNLDSSAHKKRLQSEAASPGRPKTQQSQGKYVSATSPMKPNVCAMALLPKMGQSVAPVALQHLMNEDSSVQDMYCECKVCHRLSAQSSLQQLQFGQLVRQKLVLAEKLLWLSKNNKSDETLENKAAHLNEKLEGLRDKIRANAADRQQHLETAHPYAAFAIHRIEKAVADVPLSQYPENERQLAEFGSEYVYRRVQGAQPLRGSRPQSTSGNGGLTSEQSEVLITPPQPPGKKLRALRGPLPILRLQRPPVRAHHVFARVARFATLLKGKL
eukprot:evm.model.scf_27.17 EVM.evm.TU.scf_27.17   scf_27:132496-138275(+)